MIRRTGSFCFQSAPGDMERIPATVAVLTRNSAGTLPRALESVQAFDDIIVCDGHSVDDTRAIAERFGARIITQDVLFLDETGRITDYAGVRNQTLNAARHEPFFFLDSDEYVDEVLIEAVRDIVATRKTGAWWVQRMYVRGGVVIEQASTYPNRQMRFFFRNSVQCFIKRVHERIALNDGIHAETLGGVLYVPFDISLTELRAKWRYQAGVEVLRIGTLSPAAYLRALFEYATVSLLYLFRYARIILFSRGTRMPFLFEMERHIQHLRLARALLRIVKVR
jgi:glycosyltransferase involved in cell wall biosynthesis